MHCVQTFQMFATLCKDNILCFVSQIPNRKQKMSSVRQEDSIHQYICSNSSLDPENMKTLGFNWLKLCDELDINWKNVRSKMDHWFTEVYHFRNQLEEVVVDTTFGREESRKIELYRKFFDDFEEILEKEEFIVKIQMGAARDKIKNKYATCPGDWVDLAVKCKMAENELLRNYLDQRHQCEQKQQANEKIEQDLINASHIQQRINEGIRSLQDEVSRLRDLNEREEEDQCHFRDLQKVSTVLPRQNGNVPNQQYFQQQLQLIGNDITRVTEQVKSQHKKVVQMFEKLQTVLYDLVSVLEKNVKKWKKEFQFDYAELASSADLEKQLAPWCARTGRILHDVLHESLVSWQNTLSNLPSESCESMVEQYNMIEQYLRSLMSQFIKSTFVVTEQGNFFIKVGNKRFPKFCVRVLAGDHFKRHPEETTAHFVSEEELKLCFKRNGDLDLKSLQKHERKLKNCKLKFTSENGKDEMECCFQNLQFEKTFKRTPKDQSKQVHEEKYRVVFRTKVEATACWTLSLPLVVTTASNQEAHSLASIMWQCFTTDVFNPASEIPEELPWSKVAEMLQSKMARLSKDHRLSEENISHLKERLFGEEDKPDDTLVNLTEFCWNAMVDTDFSFWKWFLGVYNMIDQYLTQFWHDGLIMGFVKKETAEKMLAKCDKAGTFILRFSDKHFTNSDGRKSVYGRLTSCVVVMKDIKGNKRNSFGQLESVKRKVIEHVDVADFKKLSGEFRKLDTEEPPKHNLANILKETWIKSRDSSHQVPMYCYLYPSGKTRQELFDKYCEEGCPVSGYKNTRVAYIAILEQTMSKMNIAKQEESAETDTDLTIGNVKKPKRRQDKVKVKRSSRQGSICLSNISSPQGSQFLAQSPHSPCQSPGYPDESPVYPGSSPAHLVLTPVMNVCSDNKAQLPTVLGEDFSGSPIPSRYNNSNPESSKMMKKTSSTGAIHTQVSATVTGEEMMDVTSENFDLFDSSVLHTCSSGQTQSFIGQLFSPDTTVEEVDLPLSVGHHITVGGADMSCENSEILIVKNVDGQLNLNRVLNIEEQKQIIQDGQIMSFLSSKLTQTQFSQVLSWLTEGQASVQTVTQPTPGPAGNTNLFSKPVTTLSDSSGESIGYSGNQLAAMGSGDIDPIFASSITEADMHG